jgi:transcription antitermination factor NusG
VRSVDHYLPLYTERVKWTDRTVVAERPLFAGYVFAHLSPQIRRSVSCIPGAHRVLGDEDRDKVSHAEIEKIREGLATGLMLRPHACASVGTRVRVRSGVFGGVEGVVAELRRQCKVVITLSGGCRSFSLEVAPEDLELVNLPCRRLHVPNVISEGGSRIQLF